VCSTKHPTYVAFFTKRLVKYIRPPNTVTNSKTMARLLVVISKTKSSSNTRPHFRVVIYNISAVRQNKTITLDDVPEYRTVLKKETLRVGVAKKKVVEVRNNKVYKYIVYEGVAGTVKQLVEVRQVKKTIEVRKKVKLADVLCNRVELLRLVVFILANAKSVTPQLFRSQKLNRKEIELPYSFMVSVPDGVVKYFRKVQLVKILKGLTNGYYRLYAQQLRNGITPEKAFAIGIIDLLS